MVVVAFADSQRLKHPEMSRWCIQGRTELAPRVIKVRSAGDAILVPLLISNAGTPTDVNRLGG